MEFVLNAKGQAIIRKCENCIHWRRISPDKENKQGYCRNIPLAFAYNGNSNMYGITNSYNACHAQKIISEEELKQKNGTIEFNSIVEAMASQTPNYDS